MSTHPDLYAAIVDRCPTLLDVTLSVKDTVKCTFALDGKRGVGDATVEVSLLVSLDSDDYNRLTMTHGDVEHLINGVIRSLKSVKREGVHLRASMPQPPWLSVQKYTEGYLSPPMPFSSFRSSGIRDSLEDKP